MIRHTVVFKLRYSKGSSQEQAFLDAAKKLANIPGVQKFECLRQTSNKNNFDFGLSMEFASQALYDEYSHHVEHAQFIEKYWSEYVQDFLEIDYEPLP